MSKASPQVFLIQQCNGGGGAGGFFRVLFWIHQVVLGLPSVFFALDLLIKGRTDGIINVIGIFLAWIGGTLVFGLAAIMHQQLTYSLPPAFTSIADSIARFETMQTHANALSAVAEAVETRANSDLQGRQFSPPLPELDFGRSMRRRRAHFPCAARYGAGFLHCPGAAGT